jgi:tRNA threonylcarbamoyladenosine biosynthesis protein TsaB
MNILSLDTTSQTLSLAITSGLAPVAELSLYTEKNHSERLMPLVDSALRGAGMDISDIDYFACSVGPGSFTGLRIGVSTVKGLAYATGKKVVPVSSLDALCENIGATKHDICPLIDARKSEVFGAFYSKIDTKQGETVIKSEEFNIKPNDLVTKIKRKTVFLGNGATLYRELIESSLHGRAIFVPPEQNYIKALNISRLAVRKIEAGGAIDPADLLPVYIRESDAVLNLQKSSV